ncbi:hypothetical protein [Hymenobacter sediminicola]|uniref:Uncharacterized protein n=1 Tax=Hymenobacter sediminicola TaxID=2761579 RepID=A0A7G7WBA9_9BACT|nr:hypothetical protein [Hymenobacter sediminicola]QNH63652.1 hypothetical protein H4317_07610 [Hymenobacter sediminicola]
MSTILSTALHLHLVPAGCRLDFPRLHGRFAYIYRRQHGANWECIAHNACSPHLDRNPPMGSTIEYKVCYCDSAGTIIASSSVVPIQVHPAVIPAGPALFGLR